MIRIAVTGPECSGKSTLSAQLSKELNWLLVDEYARYYLQQKQSRGEGSVYNMKDLESIARRQYERIHGPLTDVVIDTEMAVMKVWVEDKFSTNFTIDYLWHNQDIDLYLLCKPDLPWEADDQREDPFRREELFERYVTLFEASGRNYSIIDGTERVKMAREKINEWRK